MKIPNKFKIEMPEIYLKDGHRKVQEKLFALGLRSFIYDKEFVHHLYIKQYLCFNKIFKWCFCSNCENCSMVLCGWIEKCEYCENVYSMTMKEFLETEYGGIK